MPFAKINELALYYEIQGEGAPLLLVAGLASDSQSWGTVKDQLARQFQVIVFDNRGVGRTRPQQASASIVGMAADCVGLARYLGIDRFHLLGHSMGGLIALETAIGYPEHVDRLIVAASGANAGARNNCLFEDWAKTRAHETDLTRWFRNFFYWIFTPGFFDDAKALEEALRLAVDYPYPQSNAGFARQVRAMAGYDCRERLASIRAKTLVIAGGEDLLFPPAVCRLLSDAIPASGFAQIDQAAHAIFVEKPGGFIETVAGFLR